MSIKYKLNVKLDTRWPPLKILLLPCNRTPLRPIRWRRLIGEIERAGVKADLYTLISILTS